jgi:hypothetical protein
MRAMSKTVAIAVAGLALSLASTAAAESKSWAAVKRSINPKANVIAGGSLTNARSTKAFTSAVQMLLTEEEEAKRAFDMIKDGCGIDVPTAIADFTVVMKDGNDPLVVFGLAGLDELKVRTCLEAIALKETGKVVKLTAKKAGKVTTYSVPGERQKMDFAWLAPDVVAFTEDPTAKGRLVKALGKGPAKGDLGKFVAKINSDAALWAAVAIKEKEDGMTILGGYGSLDVAKGKWTGTANVVMGSAADVQKALGLATMGLGEIKTKAKGTPAEALINSIQVTGAGAELKVTGALVDSDINKVMEDVSKVF